MRFYNSFGFDGNGDYLVEIHESVQAATEYVMQWYHLLGGYTEISEDQIFMELVDPNQDSATFTIDEEGLELCVKKVPNEVMAALEKTFIEYRKAQQSVPITSINQSNHRSNVVRKRFCP